MRAAVAIVGILSSVAIAGLAYAADEGAVYLWVDANGTPHYEDRPPETGEAQELNLRYRLTNPEAIAAAAKRKSELGAAAGVREQQQAGAEAADQAERQKDASEREKGCQDARERLKKYDTAHRLYKPGPEGQRTYLTDEETDAARADARRTVEEWCDG